MGGEDEEEKAAVAIAPHSTLKRRATIMSNIAQDKAFHLSQTEKMEDIVNDIGARMNTEKKMGVYRKATLAALHRHATLRVQKRKSLLKEQKTERMQAETASEVVAENIVAVQAHPVV